MVPAYVAVHTKNIRLAFFVCRVYEKHLADI